MDATVKALPELIKTLKMQGYEFVTVDKLFNIPAYKQYISLKRNTLAHHLIMVSQDIYILQGFAAPNL